jgi:hypothetical protein
MKVYLSKFRQLPGTMLKKFTFIVLCFPFIHICAQQNHIGLIDSAKIPRPIPHFLKEYTFDSPVDELSWQKEKPGFHVSFASTNEAWFRSEVPSLHETLAWNETGWKGERLNAMMLVWSPDTINQVRFVVNDLKNDKGNILSKNNLKLEIVRYVISNYPYDAKEVTCGEGPVDKAWLLPDKLEEFERFDLPGKTVRPVWISLNIPSGTVPGIYNGTIEARSEKHTIILKLTIKVQNQTLPSPHDWTFRLDLWQNPWVIAEYYKVKPWSDEHKALLKRHLKLYADAGGKYITTYAVHSPWADGSYMIEGNMIEWIRRKNGSWKFDYSIFDQYVQLAMEVGIDKAITIYTPIPWGERFRYIDEATGNYITEQWLPTSNIFKTNWNVFLTDLKKHLEKKGWFNKTYLGVNENAMEQTLSAIKVIKDHSKQWKITYAGDWHPETYPKDVEIQKLDPKSAKQLSNSTDLNSLLDDYSSVFNKEPSISEIRNRSLNHKTSTFYICCTPSKPNTFVFSPPVEGRWLGWYTLAHGYDGMLRWAYDAWVADPSRDARHVYWPAGDAYMIYPGANSSIRFEKMREGIVDFEKIKILKAQTERSSNPNIKKLMQELEKHLQTFISEHEFKKEKLESDIQKGKKIVDELSEMLMTSIKE